MGQLVVRNIEDTVKQRLQLRAIKHGRSMEEEVRDLLRNAVKVESSSTARLGTKLRQRFAGLGLDADLKELRGTKVRPARFTP